MKYSISFIFLCLFKLFIFFPPQGYFPALRPLRPVFLVAVICFIAAIFDKLKNREPLQIGFPGWIILLILLQAVITIPYSIDPENSSRMVFDFFIKSVALYFIIINVVDTFDKFKVFLLIHVIGGVLLAYYLNANYDRGLGMMGRTYGASLAIGSDPNDLAMVLLYTCAFAGGLFFVSKNSIIRIFYLFSLGFLINGFIITESRGGFCGLLAMMAVLVLGTSTFKKKVAYGLLLLFVSVFFLYYYAPADYRWRMEEIIYQEDDPTGSIQARKRYYDYGLSFLADHPISSVGPGNNGIKYIQDNHIALLDAKNRFKTKRYPSGKVEIVDTYKSEIHSLLLQVGVDLGSITLILFLSFILNHFLKLLRIGKLVDAYQQKQDSKKDFLKELLLMSKTMKLAFVACLIPAVFLPVAYRTYIYEIVGLSMSIYHIAKNELPE